MMNLAYIVLPMSANATSRYEAEGLVLLVTVYKRSLVALKWKGPGTGVCA